MGKHTPLVFDVDAEGTVTIHRYTDKKKCELVATMAGRDMDDGVLDAAILFESAPTLLAACREALDACEKNIAYATIKDERALAGAIVTLRAAIAGTEGGGE